MGKVQTIPYDGAEHFTDPAAQAELLADAFESGDGAYIAQALGTIARARRMTLQGQQPEGMDEVFSDPRLSTFLELAWDLGLTLSLSPRDRRDVAAASERR